MIQKKYRDEVWKRNKEYLDNEETLQDLKPLCLRCPKYGGHEHNFSECRGEPCMELWLSNEYLEWLSI